MSNTNQSKEALRSLVASDKQVLDVAKLVYLTNKAQAVCLTLSRDDLVPEKVREIYREANETLIRAMRAAVEGR